MLDTNWKMLTDRVSVAQPQNTRHGAGTRVNNGSEGGLQGGGD